MSAIHNRSFYPKFKINSNINVELDFDTAVDLGEFILQHMPLVNGEPSNRTLVALGHQLVNLNSINERENKN